MTNSNSIIKTNKSRLLSLVLSLALVASCFAILPGTADAKSFTNSKTKITKNSAYLYNKVSLKWKKVKGAKKYQIQRAKINPKKGKIGKWKKWKTTKKTFIKRKASGDYKYRVRAVKGKKVSKWSKAKRIFAANAKITSKHYEPPFFFNMDGAYIDFKVKIKNKSKSPMGFLDEDNLYTFYVVNTKTKKVLKKVSMDIRYMTYYNHDQINPGKSKTMQFRVSGISEELYNSWEANPDVDYLLTITFYPNPRKEPMNTHMAISCTKKAKESSIACK